MKRWLCALLSIYLFFSVACANLDEIKTLGFSTESIEKIMGELDTLFEDPHKTSLDFSALGAPQLIDPLLKIIYLHMYPNMSQGGPVKSESCLGVEILYIDLSENELVEFPTWLRCFPLLDAVDLSRNSFPYWVLCNIARSPGRTSFSV